MYTKVNDDTRKDLHKGTQTSPYARMYIRTCTYRGSSTAGGGGGLRASARCTFPEFGLASDKGENIKERKGKSAARMTVITTTVGQVQDMDGTSRSRIGSDICQLVVWPT